MAAREKQTFKLPSQEMSERLVEIGFYKPLQCCHASIRRLITEESVTVCGGLLSLLCETVAGML